MRMPCLEDAVGMEGTGAMEVSTHPPCDRGKLSCMEFNSRSRKYYRAVWKYGSKGNTARENNTDRCNEKVFVPICDIGTFGNETTPFSFSERLFILKDSLMPLLRKLKETGLDINITKLDEVVSDYAELLGSIAGLALTLAGVNEDAEKPIWRTLQGENKNMMLTLAAFVKSRHFPKKPKDLLKATQDLAAKILIYQSQVATKPREAATRLKGLYQAYTTTAASPSEIHEELDEFLRKGVVEVVHKCNQRVIDSIHNMSTVDSG